MKGPRKARDRGALWALVLAGGDGVRLQELTRLIAGAPIPKQYCRIAGDRSLLELTLSRVAPTVPASRTLVVVNRDHLALARPQLAGLAKCNVVVQPANRDTGPGVVLGLTHLLRKDPDATVVLLPSDHYVHDEIAFRRYVECAAEVVRLRPHRIALLGIPPDRPEPHGALWNSMVMVFRADRMVELLGRVVPSAVPCLPVPGRRQLARIYRSLPPWNLSRDFLAHVPEHLVVVRADGIGWSDWGTPESVTRTLVGLGRTVPWRSKSDGAPARKNSSSCPKYGEIERSRMTYLLSRWGLPSIELACPSVGSQRHER